MMKKIGITGTHGAGKTTLADELDRRNRQSGKSVYVVNEVARNCPFPLGTIDAQDYIWHNQMEQEKYAMRQDVDTIFCDRTVLDNLMYYRRILEDYMNAQKYMWDRWDMMYDQACVWMATYDHVIRLPLNLEWLQTDDPIRPKDVNFARRIDALFDQYVEPYVTNHGWE